MGVEKKTKWRITIDSDTSSFEHPMEVLTVLAAAPFPIKAHLEEIVTHSCSHCGHPWPLASVDDSSLKLYRRCVEIGTLDYCCDALRAECQTNFERYAHLADSGHER